MGYRVAKNMTNENTKHEFGKIDVNKKVLQVLRTNNFNTPTPIQKQCIPEAVKEKDVVGIAQTGTGKTLAFVIPIVQNITKGKNQALIVTPTRELAIQAAEMFGKIGRPLGLNAVVLIGGDPIYQQIKKLKKSPDVIIATPGRLIDHLEKKTVKLDRIKIAVLDEADHMLDIGFLPDVEKILAHTPSSRQTLLFSATMPSAIIKIISKHMRLPVRIEIAPSGTIASGITQELYVINKHSKRSLLEKILQENKGKILVFLKTKNSVKKITEFLNSINQSAVEIHSDRSLHQRKKALNGFKEGKYRILAATDIAARGINVSNISLVINYDLPQNSEDYVHRVGRTARAGKKGKAISFVTPDQKRNVKQIERLMKKSIAVKSTPSLENQKPTKANKKTSSKNNSNKKRERFHKGKQNRGNKKRSDKRTPFKTSKTRRQQ